MTSTPTAAAPPVPPPPGRRIAAVIVLLPVIAALALWAFAWPNARTAPRDLPLGVAGPAAAAAPLEEQLSAREGAFDIHRYPDEQVARAAIEDREVYGALVATPRGPELLTATAASPLVAQALQKAVAAGSPQGVPVPVRDVVPAPAADPRGSVLSASVLPMTMAGVAGGALVTFLGLRGLRAVAALVTAAALVGLVATALTHSWLGALTGNWWLEAGSLGLTTLAVGGAVAGVAALVGRAGIGIGAMLMILLGNPFSGTSSAPEMLPEPVGFLGQLLPPGAGGSLLRSVAFFDGARAAMPVSVLGTWAVLGLAAVLVGGMRRRPAEAADSPVAEREAVPVA